MSDALSPSVFITGSSIGIGRETALRFAESGYRVGLSYFHDEDDALQASAQCKAAGAADAIVVPLNITDDASIRLAVATGQQRTDPGGEGGPRDLRCSQGQ
jgi:NAD(P)-dependent dehydrogenase (short-subunit alcohol dehydrogenase family)